MFETEKEILQYYNKLEEFQLLKHEIGFYLAEK